MNAIPPIMTPGSSSAMTFGRACADVSGSKWAALQDAANLVAALAGVEPGPLSPQVEDFPALIREATSWRRELAERGIDDIAAVMQPGIAALLSVDARGADPRPGALALWREFVEARAAVLALLPPDGVPNPLSSD
jgi:hypothetical protein